jgi:RNA polymerase sigma-70 factor, ECF subfamily
VCRRPAMAGAGVAAATGWRGRVAHEDDERLVAAARAGQLDAFNQLVARYERTAYGLAVRLLSDATLAEDITQESFLAAWSNLERFRGGHFRPWLLRIVTNRCYDELRRRQRQPANSLDALPVEPAVEWTTQAPEEAPDDHALRRELSRQLHRGIERLPPDQRATLILSDVQGHSYEEIATITGVTLGTVKSRLSRARARLRDELRRGGELFARYVRQYDEPPSP